jgi:hypothetical protein
LICTFVGRDSGEGAHRPVAPARHHRAAACEGVASEVHEVVGVGGEHELHVEIGVGERVEHAGQAGPGPPATSGGIDDRGPTIGGRVHRAGA